MAFFENLLPQGFGCMFRNQKNSQRMRQKKLIFPNGMPMTYINHAVVEKHEFENWDKTFLEAYLDFSDSHDFDRKIKINVFQFERSFEKTKFLVSLLIE